jgi:hypothetical protein
LGRDAEARYRQRHKYATFSLTVIAPEIIEGEKHEADWFVFSWAKATSHNTSRRRGWWRGHLKPIAGKIQGRDHYRTTVRPLDSNKRWKPEAGRSGNAGEEGRLNIRQRHSIFSRNSGWRANQSPSRFQIAVRSTTTMARAGLGSTLPATFDRGKTAGSRAAIDRA